MRKGMAVLLASCALLSGCQLLPRLKPQATRWYSAIAPYDTVTHREASLSVFSLPTSSASPPGILDLSPEAQAAFVQAVAEDTDTPELLASGLSSGIQPRRAPPGTRDLTLVGRRVVLSVENHSRLPANRIQQARIRIRLLYPSPDTPRREPARFVSWDKLVTKHINVDIGTLTFTQGNSIGGSLGLKLPVLEATPSGSVSATSGLTESVALSQRLVETNGALSPTEAILLQQSAAGMDLTGNVLTDFVLDLARDSAQSFYSFEHDEPRDCKTTPPIIRREFITMIHEPDSVVARITLEYTLRSVDRGHETVTESDDRIRLLSGLDSVTHTLVPRSELLVPSFLIRSDTLDHVLALRAESGGLGLDRLAPVQFATHGDAERALRWLRACGEIPGFETRIDNEPLSRVDRKRLYIDRVTANVDSTRRQSPRGRHR